MNEVLELAEDSVSIVPEIVVPEGATPIEVDGKTVGYFQDREYSPETVED